VIFDQPGRGNNWAFGTFYSVLFYSVILVYSVLFCCFVFVFCFVFFLSVFVLFVFLFVCLFVCLFVFCFFFKLINVVGYNDNRKNTNGATLADRVMAQVDREVSYSTDPLFVIIHSLAGGTGSGNLPPSLPFSLFSSLSLPYLSSFYFRFFFLFFFFVFFFFCFFLKALVHI
jgi:hypothetical protein